MHIASAPGASPEVHSIRSHVPSCHSTRRRVFAIRFSCEKVPTTYILLQQNGSTTYPIVTYAATCVVSSLVVRDTFSAGGLTLVSIFFSPIPKE